MVSSQMLVSVLDLWYFKKNTTRQNVLPQNAEYIYSDTFGLVSSRDGKVVASSVTRFDFFFKLLCRYLDDHLPENLGNFVFSSISLNFD